MTPKSPAPDPIVNALTIDVEDYFQVSAFGPHISRSQWDQLPCRVERNIERILALLDETGARATFFTLGWVAERYPATVRRIVDSGHELASHGMAHRRATDQAPDEFRTDIKLAKAVLEDVASCEVQGYRAPSFSVGPRNDWAFDCIAEAGYRYSSSLYPIRHDHYGTPNAPRFEHPVRATLVELPIATVRAFSANWPAGGGGYFRLLPYSVSRWSIRHINAVDRRPAMFYFHPWEIDPDQPRVRAGIKTRFRHYVNLKRTEPRLRQLLSDFRWDRVDQVFLKEGRIMEHDATTLDRATKPLAPAAVRPYAVDDAVRWDAFVERCPEATFFHRIGWREIIESVFRHRCHYLVAERGAAIVGVLPLAEIRSRMFGHALVSLPFCVYGGPAANDLVAERALIDAAEALAASLGVEHLELRNRAAKRADWARQDLYVTFRKPIIPDVESNMLAIPRKQRAMVRKGIKNGLASVIDPSAERFFALYADNMHRHGTPPFSRRYFERLREVFDTSVEVLTVVDSGGRPVSGVLSFYFRDEVLPYYAGDTADARELAANDFKYWELLRRACERGIRTFDYGRSKRGTGAFDFKKNWGFEPTPLCYEYRLLKRADVPQHNPLNPKYRALIALWRRLPISVANRIGPLLTRHLG